jgi:hypothetical protein
MDAELAVLQNSQVIAEAFKGRGGSIRIVTEGFVADVSSRVSASSQLGIDGTVDIQTLSDLDTDELSLPHDFASAEALLSNRCEVRLWQGKVSSFVKRGRAGMPVAPGDFLPGLLDDR